MEFKNRGIIDSGLAALGLLLTLSGTLAAPIGLFLLAFSTVPNTGKQSFNFVVLAGVVAVILAVALGIKLLRRYSLRTSGWFVASILVLLVIPFTSSNTEWMPVVVSILVVWGFMYLNNLPVASKATAIDSPAPALSVPAPAEKAPRPLPATFGCLGAVVGLVMVMLGMLQGVFSAIGAVGDTLSGFHGPIDQQWSSANMLINGGLLLSVVGGCVFLFYTYGNKK